MRFCCPVRKPYPFRGMVIFPFSQIEKITSPKTTWYPVCIHLEYYHLATINLTYRTFQLKKHLIRCLPRAIFFEYQGPLFLEAEEIIINRAVEVDIFVRTRFRFPFCMSNSQRERGMNEGQIDGFVVLVLNFSKYILMLFLLKKTMGVV